MMLLVNIMNFKKNLWYERASVVKVKTNIYAVRKYNIQLSLYLKFLKSISKLISVIYQNVMVHGLNIEYILQYDSLFQIF